jgi:hypothetical protein
MTNSIVGVLQVNKILIILILATYSIVIGGYVFGQQPANQQVEILSKSSYIDDIGHFHVVGEVENRAPFDIKFVQVVGTFYDGNDRVVGTDFTYTTPPDISAGARAPFDLILMSASVPVKEIVNYGVQANYQAPVDNKQNALPPPPTNNTSGLQSSPTGTIIENPQKCSSTNFPDELRHEQGYELICYTAGKPGYTSIAVYNITGVEK